MSGDEHEHSKHDHVPHAAIHAGTKGRDEGLHCSRNSILDTAFHGGMHSCSSHIAVLKPN